MRRGSNHSIGLPPTSSSPIKIIGYAANLHSDSVLWEEQEEGLEEMTQPTLNGDLSILYIIYMYIYNYIYLSIFWFIFLFILFSFHAKIRTSS